MQVGFTERSGADDVPPAFHASGRRTPSCGGRRTWRSTVSKCGEAHRRKLKQQYWSAAFNQPGPMTTSITAALPSCSFMRSGQEVEGEIELTSMNT